MHHPAALLLIALSSAALAAPGFAAAPKGGGSSGTGSIYSCVDAQGKRLSSDRPIPECAARDQRLHNRDGSTRAIVPPLQSPEERARADAARRVAEQQRLAREAEARRDRVLVARYPNQEAHFEAREHALEPVVQRAESARRRLTDLDAEGQMLARERDALRGKPVPAALRARLAANAGAIEAQQTILRDQEAEYERLERQFDTELMRLRGLWNGVAAERAAAAATASGSRASSATP